MLFARSSLVGLILVSSIANGDEFDELLNLSIQELLSVTVSAATLTEHTLDSTPAAATVITRKEIQLLGVDYLHELLAFVPGYQTVRGMDYSYQYAVSSRGLRSGTLGREVLYLFDGKMVNSPSNGNQGFLFMYPVNQVERVEILRGPGASLYGSNAITGVVNVVTRDGVSELSTGIGDFEQKTVKLLVNRQRRDWQLDLKVFSEQNDGDSYILPDTFSNKMVTTSDPYQQYLIDLKAQYKRTELRLATRKIEAEDFYNTGRLSNEFNESELSSSFASVNHQFAWRENITANATLSYLQLQSINYNQSTPYRAFSDISSPSSDEPLYGFGEIRSHAWQFTWHNDFQFEADSSIQFGIDLKQKELEKAHGHTNYDLTDVSTLSIPIRFYGHLDNYTELLQPDHVDAGSAYMQYQSQLNEHWYMTAGVRYDSYSKFTDRFSPRVALVHSYSDDGKFKLLYGEAYRVPDFSEVGFQNTISIRGNPNLKHEVVKTWNLIWLKNWQASQIQLGVFSNKLVNPIENSQQGDIRTFVNADSKTTSGVEIEGQSELYANWFVKLSARHMFERPESGFRESSSTFALQSNYRLDKTNFNMSAIYNSSREMFNTANELETIDGYWLAYAKVSYELTDDWKLAMRIKNLFNQSVSYPTNLNTLDNGIPARHRHWQLEFKYQF